MSSKSLEILPVHIYGLFDATGIRYVGKTCLTLKHRLSCHVAPANLKYQSHKNCWIKSLLRDGRKPEIRLLETIEGENTNNIWADRERAWISFGKRIGWDLTNTSTGGDAGAEGKIHTEHTRKRMSESRKRFLKEHPEHLALIAPKPGRFSEETKTAIAEKNKQRWNDPEYKVRVSANMRGKRKSPEHILKLSKPIVQIDPETMQPIATWLGTNFAAEHFGRPGTITNVLDNPNRKAFGYFWKRAMTRVA